MSVNHIAVGDWVKGPNGEVGFVVFCLEFVSKITFLKDSQWITHRFQNYELQKLDDNLNGDELKDLAHLALSLNQKQWFMEVTSRMKECVE
ncbi:hypothetical protein [Bacillus sp. Hm123]|uniref:hypothetical protein n=1 Tax=Bacillus sp. Hm123 TaxID=3450745 RepID=UPI003F41E554